MKRLSIFAGLVLSLTIAVAGQKSHATHAAAGSPSFNTITADKVMSHIKALSSDQFEGRSPGTHGEDLSINYIANQFKQMGLSPGNTDGTYFQKVPLASITANPGASLQFKTPAKELKLKMGDDYIAWTEHFAEEASMDAPMVFVGYGVVAPEYNWDDYKGVDVRGKVLVMLVNDPPVPDPKDPSKLDPKVFGGKAMTYYGRWTYKFEIAAEKGAAGVLLIHETGPAGYPWDVVRGSWTVEQFTLVSPDNNMSRVPMQGWITNERAHELFAAAG